MIVKDYLAALSVKTEQRKFFTSLHPLACKSAAGSTQQLQALNAELKRKTTVGLKAGEQFSFTSLLRFSPTSQRIKLLTFKTQEGCISVPSGCHSRGNVKSGEGPAVPAINTRNSENTQKTNTTCLQRTATDNSIKNGANELIDSYDSLLLCS